jgi:hypothetical protein
VESSLGYIVGKKAGSSRPGSASAAIEQSI